MKNNSAYNDLLNTIVDHKLAILTIDGLIARSPENTAYHKLKKILKHETKVLENTRDMMKRMGRRDA